MQYILMFFISFALFLAIDLVWLNILAKDLYRRELGYLMAERFNLGAAFAFYVLFVAGLIYFAIHPAWLAASPLRALFNGAFFGLVAYATYDLTNMATVARWPARITWIDLAWGSSLGGLVSICSYAVYTLVF